jgi:hypothetical protein
MRDPIRSTTSLARSVSSTMQVSASLTSATSGGLLSKNRSVAAALLRAVAMGSLTVGSGSVCQLPERSRRANRGHELLHRRLVFERISGGEWSVARFGEPMVSHLHTFVTIDYRGVGWRSESRGLFAPWARRTADRASARSIDAEQLLRRGRATASRERVLNLRHVVCPVCHHYSVTKVGFVPPLPGGLLNTTSSGITTSVAIINSLKSSM